MNRRPGKSRYPLLLAGLIGLVVLIVPLLWIGLPSRPVSAQSTASGLTCLAQPTALHCDGFQPDLSGCTQDERTIKAVPVMHLGRLVGAAQLQFSARCDAYWLMGRAQATPSITSMSIPNGGQTTTLPSVLPDGERIVLGFLHSHTPPTGADAQVVFGFPTTDPPPFGQVVSV